MFDPCTMMPPKESTVDLMKLIKPKKICLESKDCNAQYTSGANTLSHLKLFSSVKIVEIYGEAGSGKTLLCLEVVVSELMYNSKCALYISTQTHFPSSRFNDIIAKHQAPLEIKDRVFVEHLGDGASLDHFLEMIIVGLKYDSKIGIIVIDNLSASIRAEPTGTQEKWVLTQEIEQKIRVIASNNVKCLIVNEVHDSFSDKDSCVIDVQTIYPMINSFSSVKLACLGLASSCNFDTKIWMKRKSNSLFSLRELIILRSPSSPPTTMYFKIEVSGFTPIDFQGS